MLPFVQIDSATIPGGGELRLKRRGTEFSIMLGTNELMNSRVSGSEEALARLACAAIRGRSASRLLIGGLGMGFTLRAALAELEAHAQVTVAEIVPAVIDWARGPMAEIFAGSLDDPRVEILAADVGALIRQAKAAWDAILLDVDNGPEGLSRKGNDALYDPAGLAEAYEALRPGGVLAVWSSGPDAGFTRRLARAGFAVREEKVRARRGGGGARHVVWLASRKA